MNLAAQQLLIEAGAEVRDGIDPHALRMLADRRILVTGATGMIGQVLCAALPADAQVFRADSSWHIGMCINAQADFIIHAAGHSAPAEFTRDAFGTLQMGTDWTLRLARALKPGGRMLFLSSSEVYSGSNSKRHLETDIGTTKPDHERGMYVEAKRCGEAIVHAARAQGINALIARVSLAYGVGVKPHDKRVLNDFISRAILERQIQLRDSGEARRTYCYVTDVARMLLNILTRGRHSIYNVGGDGSEVSIVSLARQIGRMLNVPVHSPRGLGPAMAGAPTHVMLDTARYRGEFGPRALVGMEDGLKKTIAWHKALYE